MQELTNRIARGETTHKDVSRFHGYLLVAAILGLAIGTCIVTLIIVR